ncbi:uncharacterized protein LOC112046721 isoform X2 [Bicyclus anynana]|uniref:Uncharacterized protein LOC112046721 isoform X2 n=1 Tax=Bicyclus anynana TaxID=110368 RepID=A0ABM3LFS2_BICAN|nr:uncharacterized protein LOC112046721 isoform X2 [Bicyclus anynana]XP_052737897.1 uncharacterized protein LOC112046721 isoform X2 [Bicyclus anynana]
MTAQRKRRLCHAVVDVNESSFINRLQKKGGGFSIRPYIESGETQADPAAAGAVAARAQVPAARGVAVHAAALSDYEGCAQPYDVVSGGK